MITHGNGPQVGNILRRAEIAATEIYGLPLDTCVADSQGGIGYMLQQVLENELKAVGLGHAPVTIITQCVVSADDPAFRNPTKPIGGFMTREQAALRREKDGWAVVEDSGRGWRRVVPSPHPVEIVEWAVIKRLVEAQEIVIACGGGGIPVVRRADGELRGVEAVIDKDRASALLARQIGADLLWVVTGVERVAIRFGKPDQRTFERLTVAEAEGFAAEGHFPPGSMGPKIQAAVEFVKATGKEALISPTERLPDALAGRTGTRIVP